MLVTGGAGFIGSNFIHLVLAQRDDLKIMGINYKDQPQAAVDWLQRLGDPYAAVGADVDGRVAIEWGVYGVPETFIVDADGTIVHKHVGPIQERDLENTIRPLLRRLSS